MSEPTQRNRTKPPATAEAVAATAAAEPVAAGLKHAGVILRTGDSLGALIEALPDGLLITTPQRRIVLLNQRCAEMLGYTQAELLGARLEAIVPAVSRKAHIEQCTAFMSNPRHLSMGSGKEMWGLRRDGTRVPVDIALSPLLIGGRSFVVAVIRDVTAQRQARQALQESGETFRGNAVDITERKNMGLDLQQARDEMESLVSSVSHELRAPLRAMEGFGQALLEDYGPSLGPSALEFTRRIVDAAHHMDEVIRDLVDYSRLSRMRPATGPVDLSVVLRDSLAQLQGEIARRGAVVKVSRLLPAICCNHETLVQIVTQLISNGIKFVKKDATPYVTVSCERQGEAVRLFVSDNGIGIAPEHQDRIFRMFERLYPQEEYPGTGIGLSIVKTGVERLGGSVGVESRPGEGAVFWVDLPAA
jgi:PAS domain S-box-containing protein